MVLYFDPNAFYRISSVNRNIPIIENSNIPNYVLTHDLVKDNVVLGPLGEYGGSVGGQSWIFRWTDKDGIWTIHARKYGLKSALERTPTGLKLTPLAQTGPKEGQRWLVSITPTGGGKWSIQSTTSGGQLDVNKGGTEVVMSEAPNAQPEGTMWQIEYMRPIKFDGGSGGTPATL